VLALRAAISGVKVGPVHQTPPMHGVTDSEVDRAGAERWDGFFNRLFLDPMLLGGYPEQTLALVAPATLPIKAGDLAVIHQPVDFVGINNYSRMFVRGVPELGGLGAFPVLDHQVEGAQYTSMPWEIYPNGLYEILMRLKTEYGDPELYITENGGAFDDVLEDGAVIDTRRIELLGGYLAAAARAMAEGAKVRGYFVWSLLDNFEWAHGYSKRFGIIHTDYTSQQRVLKSSAHWYRGVIERGGFVL
jgi:beta-glucosidase